MKKRHPSRRDVSRALLALPPIAWATVSSACRWSAPSEEEPSDGAAKQVALPPATSAKTIRKSASQMSGEEINRFKRAFDAAVARGRMDVFCDEHGNHMAHHMHGADIGPHSPMYFSFMSATAGHRLLPWHRAFILDAESTLRGVLRDLNEAEGIDPADADALFIPYWDATHDRDVPAWVKGWLPQGGTAKKQPKLPDGHVGRGPSTERYPIRNCRWPGTHPAFPDLPPLGQVRMLLGAKDFREFYRILDFLPYVVPPENEAARSAGQAAAKLLPADEAAMLLMDALEGTLFSRDQALDAMNRAAELGWKIANGRSASAPLDSELQAFQSVIERVRLSAHATLHLWVSGLDPENPHIRGHCKLLPRTRCRPDVLDAAHGVGPLVVHVAGEPRRSASALW